MISDPVAPLVQDDFELQPCEPAAVKGIEEPVVHHQVLGERAGRRRVLSGPLVGRDRELDELSEA